MGRLDLKENLDERLRVIEKLLATAGERIFMALVCLGEVPAWEIHVTDGTCIGGLSKEVDILNSMLVDAGFETVVGLEHLVNPYNPVSIKSVYYSDSIEKVNELAAILDRGGHVSPSGGRFFSREEDVALGRLYGFPETAIDVYVNRPQDRVWFRQLPDEVKSADYAKLLRFMPSKANIDQELEVVKRWARVLEEKVPGLWKEYVR